jgi:outer membrane protein assembly factor BamB
MADATHAALRGMLVAAVALALAGLFSGCFWPMPGQGPGRHAHNQAEAAIAVDTVASLHQIWAASLDGGPAGDPVTSGYGVHVNGARSAYSLRPESGQPGWTSTPTAPLSMLQPFVRGRNVLVGRWDKTATASDATEGLDVTVTLDAQSGASAGTPVDGQIVALRGRFALLWDATYFPAPVGGDSWGGSLRVRDLDAGTTLCCPGMFLSSSPSPPPPAPPPVTLGSDWIFNAGPGINDPDNPAASYGNGVRGISIDNPRTCFGLYHCASWGLPLDGSTGTPPVLGDDQRIVFVGTDAGTVYAVDATTATVVWSRSVGSAVTDSPALAGGSLFVPTASGALVALAADTGAPQWAGSGGSKITQQPAVAGGVVFTGSSDGTVAAFNAAGCGGTLCPRLWSRSTGSAITGAPAVSAGQLYVGTADGRVVAFGL